jgi:SAM-dependent methyltransferase
MKLQNIEELLNQIFPDKLIYAVSSSPLLKNLAQKVTIRPLIIKNQRCYQVTEQRESQAIHHNFNGQECLEYLRHNLSFFKQTLFKTSEADFQLLVNKKLQVTILKKAATKSIVSLEHNRQKQYLLAEDKPVPFLIQLGIMNSAGKVHPQKMDKFRQINRFLEMVDDVSEYLDKNKIIHIVDFGCGKAYLTFAIYHYFKLLKGFQVRVVGLDLKKDVIQQCQKLSFDLGYDEDLQFILGDINQYSTQESVDMMVSLHACDTATDAALEKAIRWNAKVILCVPCCQHELFNQVENRDLVPLLKHGILKERFAALATDAARAQMLDILGYQTQILEFIDMEHTPKNLLIRAVKRPSKIHSEQALKDYQNFKKTLQIDPSLERRMKDRM